MCKSARKRIWSLCRVGQSCSMVFFFHWAVKTLSTLVRPILEENHAEKLMEV